MGILRTARAIAGGVLVFASGLVSAVNSPEVDRGLQWLAPRILANGSVSGEQASIGTAFQARTEVLTAYSAFGPGAPALATAVAAEPDVAVEYLARKVVSLAAASRDTSAALAALASLQNADGGFGAAAGYESNALDTGFALIALKAGGFPATAGLQSAVASLVAFQGPDGAFGINEQPSNYVTAVALLALGGYSQTYAVSSPIASARGYLLAAQVSGSYTATIDNASVGLALAATSTDAASFAGAQQALRTRQLANGSWEDDVFLTAMALRALSATATGTPPSTTAQISGRVLEDAGGAIAGARIDVVGPQVVNGLTASDGRFSLAGLTPGAYQVKVSKAGYITLSTTATLQAGINANLGDFKLMLGSNSAGLQGTVRHGVTGAPVAGANVALSGGGSTTTDAAGSYRLVGAFSGSYSVTVSKSGFDSVTSGGTFSSGTIILFSPALYPTGTTPNAATVRGRVVSAAGQTAVAGATIRINGSVATSDATGAFEIAGLTAGATSIEVTASAFTPRTFTVTLASGINDVGALAIAASGSTITLSGKVTERGTNLPIAGASLQIVNSTLAATTNVNGNYQMAGVGSTQFTLRVTAAGFVVKTFDVSLSQLVDSTVDVTLDRAASGGLVVRSTTTNRSAYDPFNAIEIEMEVENTTTTPRTLDFVATIFNAQGRAVLRTGAVPFAIAASTITEVELETHNTTEAPGAYTVLMQGIDQNGAVQVEGNSSFVINAFTTLSGGVVLDPPIVQASQPIKVKGEVFNHGNVPVPAGQVALTITLENIDPSYNPVAQVSVGAPAVSGSPLNWATGAVVDPTGVLWVVNMIDATILRVAPDNTVTTFLQLSQLPQPMTTPVDMARDAAGNLYVTNSGGVILKIAPNASVTRLTTNLSGVTSITVNAAGDGIWLATTAFSGVIQKIDPATGVATPVVQQGFASPKMVAAAADGTLYVSNSVGGAISKVTSQGAVSTFASGLNSPRGVELDSAGNVYVASGDNTVVKISADGQNRSVYSSNIPDPNALRFDSAGNLLVSSHGNGTLAPAILRIPPGGGTASVFARSLVQRPRGATYDSLGNLFVVSDTGELRKVDPSGAITEYSPLPSAGFSVTIGPGNTPYVSNNGSGNIVRYDSPTSMRTYTGLNTSQGIASNGAQLLYVAERNVNRISALDIDTGARTTVSESAVGSAEDLHVDANGDRYILNGSRIDKVSGATVSAFATSGFSGQSFVRSSGGGFHVQESFGIHVLDGTGALVRSISTNLLVRGLAIDASGFILAGEQSSKKILRINPATGAIDAAPFVDLSNDLSPATSFLAITGDGSGGLFALGSGGQVIRVPSTGGNPTLIGAVPGSEGPQRLAFDSASNTVFIRMAAGVRAMNAANGTNVVRVTGGSLIGGIVYANGLLHLSYGATNEVVSYDGAGVEVDSLAGINFPIGLAWDGTRIIGTDQVKTFTIVPGQLPKTLSRETVAYLSYANGVLYGTRSQDLVRFNATTRVFDTYYDVRTGSNDSVQATGVAAKSDGTLTFTSNADHRVVTINATKQVVASYAGIGKVTGLAFDAAGLLYAAAPDFRQVTRIDSTGQQSRVFAPFTSVVGLASVGGQIHGTRGGAIVRFDSAGNEATLGSAVSASLSGIAVAGSSVYAVDEAETKLRKLVGDQLVTIASGVVSLNALRVGGDGALYAASRFGSVVRIANGEVKQLGGDLGVLNVLGLSSAGKVFAGSASGYLTAFDIGSFRQRDLAFLPAFVRGSSTNITGVAADPNGQVVLAYGQPGDIYRLDYAEPPVPPAPGSVIGPVRLASVPELPVGPASFQIAFPDFVPPYPGDYKLSIKSTGATPGEAVNALHVGPAATGTMTASAARLPAGSATVRVSTRVLGADSTSIAKVDAARLQKYAAINLIGRAFGADAMGNFYLGAGSLYRVTPLGASEIVWTPSAGFIQHQGAVPVNTAGNVFTVAGPANRTIYKLQISAAPPATVLKSIELPETIGSIVLDSRDQIWALGSADPGHVYRVTLGDVPAFIQLTDIAIAGPYGLTIDGKDNVYIMTSSNLGAVLRIDANGKIGSVISQGLNNEPKFEYEGLSIAGDCSDNLIVAPQLWKKYGQGATSAIEDIEEHVLVQVTGRTGQVSQVVDGWQINSELQDFDQLVYDRFSGSLLIRNELYFTTGQQTYYKLPITCGAINTDLHVVLPQGQSSAGFSPAPTTTLTRDDGSTELVWRLDGVDAKGQGIAFDTTLNALTYGEKRSLVKEAFLSLQNTFAAGEIKVPLTVPTAEVDGQADVVVSVDHASYLANETVTASIVVRNRDAVARSLRLVVAVSDAQGAAVAQLGDQVVNLAPGASSTLPATFNTASNLVGTYRMQARLADAATGAPLSADTALFDIVTQGTTVLASLTADKTAYDPLALVSLSARLKNVSANAIASGLSVTLVLKNAVGTELLRQTKTVASLTPGAFQDSVFQYRLQQADIGQYTAQITVSDPSIEPRTTSFAVRSSADTGTGLRGAVVATSPVNAGDPVQIRASISNSGNASFTALPVTIRVVNPSNGQNVASWTATVAVAQNGEVEVPQVWDSSTATAGTYIAAASTTVGGRNIALGQANVVVGRLQPFTFNAVTGAAPGAVVESNSVTISGLVGTATISITGGQYRIGSGAYTSAASSVSAGNVVTVRLTAAATGNTLRSAILTVGAYSTPFDVTTVAAQDGTPDAFSFTAQSNAALNVTVVSNAVTITGIDIPVSVSVSGGEYSVNGGAYTAASGTVTSGSTVTARLVSAGSFSTTRTATVTVGGVSAQFSVTTLPADNTVDPFAFTAQTNVPVSTVRTSNAVTITGINVGVPITVTGGQYNVNGGAYTTAAGTVVNGDVVTMRVTSSAAYATAATATLTVAQLSTGFTVTTVASPDPTVAHGLAREPRVLALVTCRNAQGAEDFACTAQRRDFLDQYLTGLGIEHRVVTDSEVFRTELRCGRWNAYWLSGGVAKLTGTMAAELREAVFRGDSLLVEGARDAGSAALDAITGVGFTSSSASTGTVTQAGSILPAGTYSTTAGTLLLTLQGGVAEATFASGAPAIVSHGYGTGRTLQFAYDLVGTLIAQPNSALLSSTVDQGLDWTVLTPANPFSGDAFVAFATTIANPSANPLVVEIVATKAAAMTFNTSTPATQTVTSTQLTWRVTVPAQGSAVINWSVRTPQATGSYPVQFQANRIDGTTSTPIGATVSVPVDVVALAQGTTQTVAALNALSLTATPEQQARSRAVTAVNDALAKANQGLYEAAISKYLAAGDELDAITSLPTSSVQVAIDRLLKEVSRNWCRGGTSCSVGTATGSSYGVMVLNAASFTNGSSTGSIGVGGAVTLSSYTVASALSGDVARLVGGSTINWTNGSVGQSGSGVIRGGSTATISQSVGRREVTPNTVVENWPTVRIDQLARSDRYAAMSGTAATTAAGNALNCTGTNATWNVCNMTAAQVNAARTINLNYPATSSVLVNVTGTTTTFTNGQTRFNGVTLQNNALAKQVIFNMAQMTNLTVDGWGWAGTLLAPRATVTHRNSMIDGQAVFSAVTSTGSYQCNGTFDRVTP